MLLPKLLMMLNRRFIMLVNKLHFYRILVPATLSLLLD